MNSANDPTDDSNNDSTDVLILGGGVAGLAAASHLSKAGLTVKILEGRDRLGGRICTWRDPIAGFPVEVGAEFVHGRPAETLSLIHSSRLSYYDCLDTRFERRDGKLQPMDSSWDKLDELMDQLEGDRKEDRSFADFLKAHEGKTDSKVLELARNFVEGFHASDVTKISEKGLAASEQVPDGSDATDMFRIPEGYNEIVRSLVSKICPAEEPFRLNHVVKSIAWKAGSVEVETVHRFSEQKEIHRAPICLIALPLGVLKSPPSAPTHVKFTPEPPHLAEALSGMEMGAAIRITFRFRNRHLWEDQVKDPIGFLHALAGSTFPVWWTSMPMRLPLLTAWVGGPKAAQLAKLNKPELVDLALQTLSQLLGKSTEELRSQLQSCVYHDWFHDPFSFGAYSYITVNGKEKIKRMKEPVENTLFFAGEALFMGEQRGTVSGAIATGYKAARKILEARPRA